MGDKLQMCHPEFISGSKRERREGDIFDIIYINYKI